MRDRPFFELSQSVGRRPLSVLACLALVLVCQSPVASGASQSERPNVLLIISDDQAWTDFGFMGHPAIETPELDALAEESMVFPRGYVPTALCRASLATIITGLYAHEHQLTGNDPPRGVDRALMLEHIAAVDTLPGLLGEVGYKSLQTGKWWEGDCRCGDFTEGMTHGDPKRGGRHGDLGLKIGRDTMAPAFDFIDACSEAGDPFFLWYAPFLPHRPHNPPERLLEKYRGEGVSDSIARYYAMCEWFDETCGQLLDHLDEKKLADDTIVLYVTDNGWIQRADNGRYAPRSKRSQYDGGLRTPIMVRWPGKVKPEDRPELANSIDLAPTILKACGLAPTKAMQGIDLRQPAHTRTAKEREVYSEEDHEGNILWSIRTERMKLIGANEGNPRGLPTRELFEIDIDPKEEYPLDPGANSGETGTLEQHADLHRRAAEGEAVADSGEADMSFEECEQLRMLGYVEDCSHLQ